MHRIDARLVLAGLMCLAAGLWATACQSDAQSYFASKRTLDQTELLVPKKIEILSFTKPKSFNDDQTPDGIFVVLAAKDVFGDNVKAVGDYRFELFRFRPASGDHKGDRLGFWEQSIRTVGDHNKYWHPFSQTYEFELYWDRPLETNQKYVLQVTYTGADQRRLFDEYVFEFRLPPAMERARQRSIPGRT